MSNSPENLTLKITTAVDGAATSTLSRSLKDLTKVVEDLGKAAQKAFGAFGGMGKGGNFTPTAGAGSAVSQIGAKIGAGGSGSGGLGNSVQNAANLFKAAGSSKGALKMMQSSLSDMVGRGDADIKRLVNSLQSLESQYNKLKNRQLSVGGRADVGPGSALGAIHEDYLNTTGQLARARQGHASVQAQFQELNVNPEAAAVRSLRASMGFGPPGAAGGGGAPGGGAGGGMGVMGFLARAGGYAGAAFSGVEYGLHLVNQNTRTNLQYAMASPLFDMSRQATLGQIYGGNAQSIRSGDAARAAAMIALSKDPASAKLFSMDMADKRRQALKIDNSVGIGQALLQGDAARAASSAAQQAGSGLAGIFNDYKRDIGLGMYSLPGSPDVKHDAAWARGTGSVLPTLTPEEIAYKTAKANEGTLAAEQYQTALKAKMDADPMFNARINDKYNGALGVMAMARATGRSGGWTQKKDLKTGLTVGSDQMHEFEAAANRQGFTGADKAAVIQQMMGSAGRGNMNMDIGLAMQMGAGGFAGASAITGAGVQFGNRGLLSAVQHMIGGGRIDPKTGEPVGGIDAVAGSSIFGMGASLLTRGDFSGDTGGGNLMQVLADAGLTGTAGGDLRRARELTSGMGLIENINNGKIDKLGDAMSWSSAIHAAPHASLQVHQALHDMSFSEKAEIIKSGKLDPGSHYGKMGMTAGMVIAYQNDQNQRLLARTAGGSMLGGEVLNAYNRYQSAHGNLGYIKGMSSKARMSELDSISSALTTGLSGENLTAARGALFLQASLAGVLPKTRGKGAYSSASTKSAAGVAAKVHGDFESDTGEKEYHDENDIDPVTGKPQRLLTSTFKGMVRQTNAGEAERKHGQYLSGFEQTDAVIDRLSKDLVDFVAKLAEVAKEAGGGSGPAKGSSKGSGKKG